MYQISWH